MSLKIFSFNSFLFFMSILMEVFSQCAFAMKEEFIKVIPNKISVLINTQQKIGDSYSTYEFDLSNEEKIKIGSFTGNARNKTHALMTPATRKMQHGGTKLVNVLNVMDEKGNQTALTNYLSFVSFTPECRKGIILVKENASKNVSEHKSEEGMVQLVNGNMLKLTIDSENGTFTSFYPANEDSTVHTREVPAFSYNACIFEPAEPRGQAKGFEDLKYSYTANDGLFYGSCSYYVTINKHQNSGNMSIQYTLENESSDYPSCLPLKKVQYVHDSLEKTVSQNISYIGEELLGGIATSKDDPCDREEDEKDITVSIDDNGEGCIVSTINLGSRTSDDYSFRGVANNIYRSQVFDFDVVASRQHVFDLDEFGDTGALSNNYNARNQWEVVMNSHHEYQLTVFIRDKMVKKLPSLNAKISYQRELVPNFKEGAVLPISCSDFYAAILRVHKNGMVKFRTHDQGDQGDQGSRSFKLESRYDNDVVKVILISKKPFGISGDRITQKAVLFGNPLIISENQEIEENIKKLYQRHYIELEIQPGEVLCFGLSPKPNAELQ